MSATPFQAIDPTRRSVVISALIAVVVAVGGLSAAGGPASARHLASDIPEVGSCNERVDLAVADARDIETLPGVSKGMARRIVRARDKAPLQSVRDLVDRGVVTPGALVELLASDPCLTGGADPRIDYYDELSCDAPESVDLNSASLIELEDAFPGLIDGLALVEQRPIPQTIQATEEHSQAARRALAEHFAQDQLCIGAGPYETDEGSAQVWVNPGDAFALTVGDRMISGNVGAVADGCWATISVLDPASVPVPQTRTLPSPTTSEADAPATNFDVECGVATEVTLSWVIPELIGSPNGTEVLILHGIDGGWEALRADVDGPTGRVEVVTDDLSPFAWLVRRFSGGQLNEAEIEVCGLSLSNVSRCYWTGKDAVPWVTSQTISKFGNDDDSTQGNAYKHCLWNAIMTDWYGTSFAESFATAHENFDGNDALTKEMDLHNNQIGRNFALLYIDWEAECFAGATDGRLNYIVDGVIVPTDYTPPVDPPPGGGSLQVNLFENPFLCDGGPSRNFGTVSGALPGERIDFFSPEIGTLLSGNADGNGALTIIWQCDPGDAGTVWTVNATAATSGRTATFTVTGT